MDQKTIASSRQPEIDVLRGFALLGILVVNYYAFNTGVFGFMAPRNPAAVAPQDTAAEFLVQTLFQSKFILMFAFLIGWGIHTQAQQGPRFRRSYLRRLAGLFLIGLVHGILFFSGDILITYAVLGLFMLRPVRKDWPVRRLVRNAIILLSLSAAVTVLLTALMAAFPTATSDTPLLPDTQAIYTTGSFAAVSLQRLTELAIQVPFVVLILGLNLVAMFRLGLAAAKTFAEPGLDAARPLARRLIWLTLAPGLLTATLCAYFSLAGVEPAASISSPVQQLVLAPLLSIGYLCAAVLALTGPLRGRLVATLGAAGRMSLSIYLLQSVIMSLLFSGYGLGLYGRVAPASGLALCVAVYVALIGLAALWSRAFRIGPVEWALRSFTAWQVAALRRRGPADQLCGPAQA